jgi:multiple sugar transport system substrate-binding protein
MAPTVPTAPTAPMTYRRWRQLPAAVVIALAVALGGAGCGSAAESEGEALTFWTPFNTPDRMAKQQATVRAFTQKTGIKVKIVGLKVEDMNQSMVSGAASGDVPDVALHAPDQGVEWNAQGLLDVTAANAIIDELGRDTFNKQALNLVTVGGKPVTVPSDAWGQMLFYRKDLFDEAGLTAPKTLDDVVAAARRLDEGATEGIVLGTKPGEAYTMQTLEWMGLSNGCQLTQAGAPKKPTLDSPACVGALRYYQQLAEASAEGAQDVMATRAAYLAGRAAMISFSSHLLDEIAGVDPQFPPACPECKKNRAFLAENTRFVTILRPPGAATGQQYGQTLNLAILRRAKTDQAKQFVRYLLTDGYQQSLAVGAEGRFPMRAGARPGGEEFVKAWAKLPVGPDPRNTKSVTDIYGEDMVAGVEQGATRFSRWGLGQGAERLSGALYAQGVLTRDLEGLFQGQDPAAIARKMNQSATQVAQELGD